MRYLASLPEGRPGRLRPRAQFRPPDSPASASAAFERGWIVPPSRGHRTICSKSYPVGDYGSALRYAVSVGLGHLAMDRASSWAASGDADAALDAASRIGTMSYAGHVRADPPRVPGNSMAYDHVSDPLSLGALMPGLAARFAVQDALEHNAFAVVNPESKHADERLGRRSRASAAAAMALDTGPAGRSGAPSISQVFGAEFAATLNRIGTAPR